MILTDHPAGPDQFKSVHGVKVLNDGLVHVADRNYRRIQVFRLDSRGNLYTAETQPCPVGSRVQRFAYTGLSAAPAP